MTAKAIIAILDAVDSGKLSTRITSTNGSTVEYETASGWRLRVFEDCGDWNYLDAYAAPGADWVDVEIDPDPAGVLWWNPKHLWRWHWAPEGSSPNGYMHERTVAPIAAP